MRHHPALAKPTTHTDLLVWQLAMELAQSVYELTRKFPREEQFGLTAQLRRAAVSLPSNIAEGAARRFPKEFLNHLGIARGSLAEIQTQILLANRLGYAVENSPAYDLSERVFQLLNALIARLQKR